MGEREGQQLGNYRLIHLLGEGGFAEVYLGEHVHLNTHAAIKVLHTRLASNDIEQFRNEARTLAHLVHPHIVRVLEFGVGGAVPFLVMDYAPNGSLRHRHPKGVPVPLPIVVSYVKQVASALQYAHDHKLIHRDVKPENMLLGRHDVVLLSDFGIATIAHSTFSLSEQNMAGTLPYIAPEQLDAHSSPASDQYSLGIVVYEWLSGDLPFHGSFMEIAVKHRMAPPPSLLEKVPMLSPIMDQVVMRALAKDPNERFDSIWAFAEALEQASWPTSIGSSALPQTVTPSHTLLLPGASHKPQRHLSRRTMLLGLGLTGLALAGGGITWFAAFHGLTTPFTQSTPASCSRAFSDTFTTSLDSRWTLINPGSDATVTAQGSLRISVPIGHDLYPDLINAPRLLQPIEGNFTAETLVDFNPKYKYQGAGIIVWQDTNNFIRLEHGYGDFGGIAFEQEANGSYTKFVQAFFQAARSQPTTATRVGLRVQREDNRFIASWYSPSSGINWQEVGDTQATFKRSVMVGLAVVNSPQSPHIAIANFDFFRVACH
jgi:serine/threonine protein kinase/regulation of enolase protein 1 (concanavalin A-like superfamily)